MPSSSGQPDRVVLAMAPGQNRSLLAEWLAARPNYEVTTTGPEEELPNSYDVCLLDVRSFRAYRSELTARVEGAEEVYPHTSCWCAGGRPRGGQKIACRTSAPSPTS